MIDVKETKEEAVKYSDRAKFDFPVLLDSDGKVATLYAPPAALPDLPRDQVPIASNLIVDPEGKIQFYSLLDSANFDARLVGLSGVLEKLLSGK